MIRDVAATMVARVLGMAFGVVTSILTARYLGPAGRGEYFLVMTVLSMIGGLGVLGLPGTFMYLGAKDHGRVAGLHANAVWISVAMGVLGTAIAQLAALAFPGSVALPPSTLAWLYVLAPVAIYGQLCAALLMGVGRIVMSSGAAIVQGGAIIAAMIVAISLGADVQGFLAATTAGNVLYAMVSAASVAVLVRLTLRFDPHVIRQGVGFGLRSFLISACGLVLLRANVLVLGYHADHAEVGYYSIAAQLGDSLAILPGAVSAALFPRLMKLTQGRWQATQRTLLLCGAVHLAACVVTGLCAPIIPYVFGEGFRPSIVVLYWLLPGAFFYGLTTIVSQYLAAAGIPRSLIAVWAMIACLIVLSSVWLIPAGGAVGAAMALSISCTGLFASAFALAVLRVSGREAAEPQLRPQDLPP